MVICASQMLAGAFMIFEETGGQIFTNQKTKTTSATPTVFCLHVLGKEWLSLFHRAPRLTLHVLLPTTIQLLIISLDLAFPCSSKKIVHYLNAGTESAC